jgi:hypothetical protein
MIVDPAFAGVTQDQAKDACPVDRLGTVPAGPIER